MVISFAKVMDHMKNVILRNSMPKYPKYFRYQNGKITSKYDQNENHGYKTLYLVNTSGLLVFKLLQASKSEGTMKIERNNIEILLDSLESPSY